jgi:hypothetical protein
LLFPSHLKCANARLRGRLSLLGGSGFT